MTTIQNLMVALQACSSAEDFTAVLDVYCEVGWIVISLDDIPFQNPVTEEADAAIGLLSHREGFHRGCLPLTKRGFFTLETEERVAAMFQELPELLKVVKRWASQGKN